MTNKNTILFLILPLVLASCCGKNKMAADIGKSQAAVSKTNSDKNLDIMFLETVYFGLDSSALTAESKQNLNLLARYLKDPNNGANGVILSGHCDDVGSDGYNYDLGLKRAKETKNYLVSMGIDNARISMVSHGKSGRPEQSPKISLEESEEIRRLDRKVAIELANMGQ